MSDIRPTAESVLNIIAGYVMYDDREDAVDHIINARSRGHNDVKKGIREIITKYTNIQFEDNGTRRRRKNSD